LESGVLARLVLAPTQVSKKIAVSFYVVFGYQC